MSTLLTIKCGKRTVVIAYADKEVEIARTTGMIYLLELLSHPWQQIDAEALARINKYDPDRNTEISETNLSQSETLASPIPYCDDLTISQVKQRLLVLVEEISEARAWNDPGRAEELIDEKESIEKYLCEVLSPQGRIRRMTSATRKACVAVNKALVRAIGQIAMADTDLAMLLQRSLKTWGRLCYTPGDELEIRIRYGD